jgi:hypothetical protein
MVDIAKKVVVGVVLGVAAADGAKFALARDHSCVLSLNCQVDDKRGSITVAALEPEVALAPPTPTRSYRLLDRPAPRKAAEPLELQFRLADPVCVRVSRTGSGVRCAYWTATLVKCNVDESHRFLRCSIVEKKGRRSS